MIRISGYSDDNVLVEDEYGQDEEISCFDKTVVLTFEDILTGEGVEISVWYEGPSWAFTIMQLPDEEIPVPWTLTLDQDSDYSMVLEIQSEESIKWSYIVEER